MTSLATKKASAPKGKAGSTTDDFLGGRLGVVQPRTGHRAGGDAVFLAACVPAEAGERVLEAGTGVGVTGLCLLARISDLKVTAVEIDARLCALAKINAARNGFADQFTVIEGDVTAQAKFLRAAGLVREGYDHVIANPPFHAPGAVNAALERFCAIREFTAARRKTVASATGGESTRLTTGMARWLRSNRMPPWRRTSSIPSGTPSPPWNTTQFAARASNPQRPAGPSSTIPRC